MFVTGVVADYMLKVHRGEQAEVGSSFKAHMGRIVPWAITLFIAGTMLHRFLPADGPRGHGELGDGARLHGRGRRMLDAPIRSVRLFTKDWPHVLQILAVGIIDMFPIHIGLFFISAFPGVRTLARGHGVAQRSLMPFGLLFA